MAKKLKKLYDPERILILWEYSDPEFLKLKSIYNRDQKVIYKCDKCGKENRTTLRKMDKRSKLCCNCSAKQAILAKYGVECLFTTEYFKEKSKKTISSRTEEEKHAIVEKRKQTNLERYGEEFPYSFLTDNMNRIIQEKYGVDNVSKLEEIKEKKSDTLEKNYGVRHTMRSEELRQKQHETLLKKYGVEYPLQSPEILSKKKRRYTYENMQFDSSWELIFYLYHKFIIKDDILREPMSFEYRHNSKSYYYFPDFSVDGILIEIKPKRALKTGILKSVFNPNLDEREAIKQKIIEDNNIQFVFEDTIKKYSPVVLKTFGEDILIKSRNW